MCERKATAATDLSVVNSPSLSIHFPLLPFSASVGRSANHAALHGSASDGKATNLTTKPIKWAFDFV